MVHVGVDDTGDIAVDPDAIGRQFRGQGLDHGAHRRFGGGVHPAAHRGEQRRKGGGQKHYAAPVFHGLKGDPGAQVDGLHVGIHRLVPQLLGGVDDAVLGVDPRVAHPDVHGAQSLLGVGRKGLQRAGVGDVAGRTKYGDSLFLQLLHRLFQLCRICTADGHLGAQGTHQLRTGQADSAGSAGDERGLVVKSNFHMDSFLLFGAM